MTTKVEQPLTVRNIARDAIGTYRRHWTFLVPAAVVVLIPQALADAFLDGLNVEGVNSARDIFILAAVPLTAGVSLMGEALYAGLVAAAVVEARAGHPVPGLTTLARSLPIGRLMVVDLILTLGTALGFVLLVIPGLIFLAYFGIVPAILKLEHAGIWEGFKRSASLVRGHFWRVLAIVVGITLFTEIAMQALTFPFHGLAVVAVIDLIAEGILEPFQGLATVLVAIALIQIRGELPAPGELAIAPAAA